MLNWIWKPPTTALSTSSTSKILNSDLIFDTLIMLKQTIYTYKWLHRPTTHVNIFHFDSPCFHHKSNISMSFINGVVNVFYMFGGRVNLTTIHFLNQQKVGSHLVKRSSYKDMPLHTLNTPLFLYFVIHTQLILLCAYKLQEV